MTPQDHMLIITMLARQERMIQTLADIISRDAMVKDDTEALDKLRLSREQQTPLILDRIVKTYRATASKFGLDIPEVPVDIEI